MLLEKQIKIRWCVTVVIIFLWIGAGYAESEVSKENIYPVGKLKPTDSVTTLKIGDQAPDFTLPAIDGEKISLSHYKGKKNVVISFVPAAWTPVCTMQWPIYNITKDIFDNNDAILLGITVDNIPTLYAWTNEMGKSEGKFWFPVLSDFFPHGQVAKKYGVLRSEGVSERALFVIDKEGIIRYIDVHDINARPSLQALAKALKGLNN
jgi:peroxiredoxin (alkyl hydroperoxide reductase subunit C)